MLLTFFVNEFIYWFWLRTSSTIFKNIWVLLAASVQRLHNECWRIFLHLDAIAASVKLAMVMNSGFYYFSNSFAGWQFSPVGWRVRLR